MPVDEGAGAEAVWKAAAPSVEGEVVVGASDVVLAAVVVVCDCWHAQSLMSQLHALALLPSPSKQ